MLLCFAVDKKTVTFDVHSQRPETGEKSTLYTADGTSFVDDTMTVTSGKEPSVVSGSSHTSQTTRSFISLKPTEQVMLKLDLKLSQNFALIFIVVDGRLRLNRPKVFIPTGVYASLGVQYFYFPVDEMLVNCRVTLSINPPVPFYTPG